jgi:diguanylate cyclase (GGDEF)-like protein
LSAAKPPAKPGVDKASPVATTPLTPMPPPSDAMAPLGTAWEWLSEVRGSYEAILTEMDFRLEEGYLKSLTSLRLKVQDARHPQDLLELGPQVQSQVRRFAQLLLGERSEAASFVVEVVRQLAAVEAHLRATATHSVGMHRAGQQLTTTLSAGIEDLGETVLSSVDLDQVKVLVAERLQRFRLMVDGFHKEERGLLLAMSHELEQLRENVRQIKGQVTQLEEEKQTLAGQLRQDPLTGAANRLAIEERLRHEISRLGRYGRPFSVLLFDLDRFKRINDTYGHGVGDRCLKEVVAQVKARVRSSDMVGRYGGEEFVVILPETQATAARVMADKLRQAIEETEFAVAGERLLLTISIGVAPAWENDSDAQTILDRADLAMYRAKEAGRNQVVLATSPA